MSTPTEELARATWVKELTGVSQQALLTPAPAPTGEPSAPVPETGKAGGPGDANPGPGKGPGQGAPDPGKGPPGSVPDPGQGASPPKRTRAVITWAQPAPVEAVDGGYKPGPGQLNATVEPPAAGIVYVEDGRAGLGVGTHRLVARVKDTVSYEGNDVAVDLVVTRRKADVTWAVPAPQPWVDGGYVLGDAQLCAVVVQGPAADELEYDPPAGTALEPGDHPLKVRWPQTDVYEADVREVTFTVQKVPVRISWDTPEPAEHVPGGVRLGDEQLNATTDVEGVELVYDPPAGKRLSGGTHTLSAAVADPAHYVAEPARVSWEITRATPAITWETPGSVVIGADGHTLSARELCAVIGPGGGKLTYEPALGTKLTTVGDHPLKVTSERTSTHESATATVTLTLRKPQARCTWQTPAWVDVVAPDGFELGDAQLNATCSVPGVKLKYTPAKGTKLKGGDHVLKVEADDPDKVDLPAATVTLKVRRLKPEITWESPTTVAPVAGDKFKLTAAQLNAVRKTGDQALVYTPPIDTELAVGTHELTVTHPQSELYEKLEKSVKLIVMSAAKKSGFDAAAKGDGFSTALEAGVKADWDADTDNVKTNAQEIMKAARTLTGPELIALMNQKSKEEDRATQDGTHPNLLWRLPGGLQVRYKPNGDTHSNPTGTTPVPMFCVEILSKGCTTKFSNEQGDVATKISLDGKPAPKGPGTTSGDQNFKEGAVAATHLQCIRMKDAVIVAPATVTLAHGVPLSLEALGARLDPGDGKITMDRKVGEILEVKANQLVKLNAAATKTYSKAAEVQVRVTVTKSTPTIDWAQPADLTWNGAGASSLTATQLNAKADPDYYTDRLSYQPDKKELLPGVHTLTASLTRTLVNEAATRSVQIVVHKAEAVLAWPDPPALTVEPGGTYMLDDKVQKATTPVKGLKIVYDPPPGTELGPGVHELMARTAEHKSHRQAVRTVKLEILEAAPGEAVEEGGADEGGAPAVVGEELSFPSDVTSRPAQRGQGRGGHAGGSGKGGNKGKGGKGKGGKGGKRH